MERNSLERELAKQRSILAQKLIQAGSSHDKKEEQETQEEQKKKKQEKQELEEGIKKKLNNVYLGPDTSDMETQDWDWSNM